MFISRINEVNKNKLNNIILKLQEFMGDKEIFLRGWRAERRLYNEEYTPEFENIVYEGLVDKFAQDIEEVRRFPIYGVSRDQEQKIKNLQNAVINMLELSTYKNDDEFYEYFKNCDENKTVNDDRI